MRITLDQTLFQAILYNLISNAIKYSKANTSVTILTQKKKKIFEILVCDTGPGFKYSTFEENILYYNQEQKDEIYSSSNYGLGLYLSYLISQKIGITLSIEKNGNYNNILKIKLKESQVRE